MANKYKIPGSRRFIYLAVLFFILITSMLYSLGKGASPLGFKEALNILFGFEDQSLKSEIILNIRLPRILLSALIGGGLALCGVVMQAVVRNPLANPYLMGVSSGASLGATIFILLFAGTTQSLGLPFSALLGGLLSSIAVFGVAIYSKANIYRLLLAGIAMNTLCSAISSLIIFLSDDPQKLRTVIFWLMGSLAPSSWDIFWVPALAIIISGIFFITQKENLNIIMLGDDEAFSLGINPQVYRLIYLLLVALTASVIVAYFGVIAFVGIIIPHIIRLIYSGDHKILVPFSLIGGALFMAWADVASRSLTSSEIPIGVITGLVGSPIFFWLLLRPERN